MLRLLVRGHTWRTTALDCTHLGPGPFTLAATPKAPVNHCFFCMVIKHWCLSSIEDQHLESLSLSSWCLPGTTGVVSLSSIRLLSILPFRKLKFKKASVLPPPVWGNFVQMSQGRDPLFHLEQHSESWKAQFVSENSSSREFIFLFLYYRWGNRRREGIFVPTVENIQVGTWKHEVLLPDASGNPWSCQVS